MFFLSLLLYCISFFVFSLLIFVTFSSSLLLFPRSSHVFLPPFSYLTPHTSSFSLISTAPLFLLSFIYSSLPFPPLFITLFSPFLMSPSTASLFSFIHSSFPFLPNSSHFQLFLLPSCYSLTLVIQSFPLFPP